jgi:hypothetical protein
LRHLPCDSDTGGRGESVGTLRNQSGVQRECGEVYFW